MRLPRLPQRFIAALCLSTGAFFSTAQAELQTLTVLGADGTAGSIDAYSEASRDQVNWGPAYLFTGHPWGLVEGTNAWLNYDPDPSAGIGTDADHTFTYYRIRFVAPDSWVGEPSVLIRMIADNRGHATLNSTFLGTIDGGGSFSPSGDALVPGVNTLYVTLEDWGGINGINYRIDITVDSDDGFILAEVTDTDIDGLNADEEAALGTDPDNPDTDGDGVLDGVDPNPLDPRPELEAKIAQLEQQLSDCDDLVALLSQQASDNGDTIDNLQAQLNACLAHKAQLESDLSAAQGEIATLSADLDAAKTLAASLQTQLDTALANNTALTADLATANSTIATLQNDLGAAQATIVGLQTDLDSANVQIGALTAELTACQAHAADLQSQLDAANAQIASLTDDLASANDEIAALTADLAAANQTIADQAAQIGLLETNLAAANAAIVELEAINAAQAALLGAIDGDISAYEAYLRVEFRDPDFVIAGGTSAEKVANLVAALLDINRGRNLDIYRKLGGEVGRHGKDADHDEDKKDDDKKKESDKSGKRGRG